MMADPRMSKLAKIADAVIKTCDRADAHFSKRSDASSHPILGSIGEAQKMMGFHEQKAKEYNAKYDRDGGFAHGNAARQYKMIIDAIQKPKTEEELDDLSDDYQPATMKRYAKAMTETASKFK